MTVEVFSKVSVVSSWRRLVISSEVLCHTSQVRALNGWRTTQQQNEKDDAATSRFTHEEERDKD
jgi:hypothetical protein